MSEEILVYDIETRTFGLPNANVDEMRLFVCYSYKTNKKYILTKITDIQKVINSHKYLIGFNVKAYDNPILIRHNINFEYKIIIDLFEVIKKRSMIIKLPSGELLSDVLMSYSLDDVTRMIGLADATNGKMEIDYKIFNKPTWSADDIKIIRAYSERDIELTKKLYDWLEYYFGSFKDFLTEKDIKNKSYISSSPAVFAYKAIGKEMNWDITYSDSESEERILGGYVAYPAGEKFENNIYALDFASLYPHIMIQCNIYGRKASNNDSDRRPIWKTDIWKVDGEYYSDKLSSVSELLHKWYNMRLEYKRQKDHREYPLKILMNTCYGLLDNPSFMLLFDRIAASDVTSLGRQFIRYARKRYRDEGYIVIYSDTDSIYVQDPFNDKVRMLAIKQSIVDYIRSTLPFPQSTFDMVLEYEIKYMYFFKGGDSDDIQEEIDDDDIKNKPLGFMKKNYIFVTSEGKLVIKNLGIRKKSNTQLSRKIFWEYLVPKIKEGQIKFSKAWLRNIIIELLQKDVSLIALRKEVDNYERYREKSPNSLPAQIAQKYGAGVHFLIPNTKNIGVGKDKRYCTLMEFRSNALRFDDIDLDNVWNELDYFISQPPKKNIFEFV